MTHRKGDSVYFMLKSEHISEGGGQDYLIRVGTVNEKQAHQRFIHNLGEKEKFVGWGGGGEERRRGERLRVETGGEGRGERRERILQRSIGSMELVNIHLRFNAILWRFSYRDFPVV